MLDKKTQTKIRKYAKLRGGESYNDSDPDKLMAAFEKSTPEWQKVYLEAMDIYFKSVKSGKTKPGESIQKK